MAGRPKIFDEQEALEKAANLFWQKGYEATSTEDLIQAMGVQRGSFYHTFGSKKELYVKALHFYEMSGLTAFKKLLKDSENPIELIKSMFLSMVDCPTDEHKKGCFAGNTISELTSIDEELADKAKEYLKEMETLFFDQIKLSQASGELKTKVKAKILARYLLNLWNGINITRRIYPSKKKLIELIEFQLEVLK
jgi:TetR/AcrR family transcriptional regulator, transcriptional repressor for nem operon